MNTDIILFICLGCIAVFLTIWHVREHKRIQKNHQEKMHELEQWHKVQMEHLGELRKVVENVEKTNEEKNV